MVFTSQSRETADGKQNDCYAVFPDHPETMDLTRKRELVLYQFRH
jgi:hypothetical protein